ncbi:MAG: hypothetical protein IPM13_15645 [Phycisphaerales bacterium]|nr:hypothetical protein [Phycisphaerales bacterium]
MNSTITFNLDRRVLARCTLALSALVLVIAHVLLAPRMAVAIGQQDRAGDYKVLTQVVNNSRELLIVSDAAAQVLAYYEYDISSKKLELVQRIPLDQLPVPPPEANVPQVQPQRRRP